MMGRCAVLFSLIWMTSWAHAAPPLPQDYAPEHAMGVLSVSRLATIREMLEDAEILEESDADAMRGMLKEAMLDLPDPMVTSLEELLDDTTPLEVLTSVSMGMGLWLESDPKNESRQLVIAGWMDLSNSGEKVHRVMDAGMAELRSRPDVRTRDVAGHEVDVIPMRPQLDGDDVSLFHLRLESEIYLSNLESGLERMLEAREEGVLPDALAGTDHWKGVMGMLDGPDHLSMAMFVGPIFDAATELRPEMGMMTATIRGSFDAAIGPVRALAVSAGVGENEVMLDWSGGVWMPEGPGGFLRLMASESPVSALPGWIGSDVWSVERFNFSYHRLPDWMRSVVASNAMLMGVGQMLDQAEPTMRAMLSPLGSRTLMISMLSQPLTAESLSTVVMVPTSDGSALSDVMGAQVAAGGMKAREFQGHQIWSAPISEMMPMPFPGGSESAISLSVASGNLMLGDESAVETALRGVGERAARPEWLGRVLEWLPDEPVAAWGGRDLAQELMAGAEIARMQMQEWEASMRADDPELWEEIRGELEAEQDVEQRARLARLSQRLGPSAWRVQSGSHGFRVRGVVMRPSLSD